MSISLKSVCNSVFPVITCPGLIDEISISKKGIISEVLLESTIMVLVSLSHSIPTPNALLTNLTGT